MVTLERYRILSIEDAAQGTRVFRLGPVEGGVFGFEPGQFAMLHILDEKGGSVVKRPYSIASSPDMPYLEFCIKLVGGELTGRLEKLKEGALVGIEGPLGHFGYNGQEKAAFIAGGTGVSPFVGMLRHIAHTKRKGSFLLFYSARTRDSILYHEELERLDKENPDIRVVITLTREEPEGWAGECGRVDERMIDKYSKAADYCWWLCGPLKMIKGMKECLLGRGVDPKDIQMEGWG